MKKRKRETYVSKSDSTSVDLRGKRRKNERTKGQDASPSFSSEVAKDEEGKPLTLILAGSSPRTFSAALTTTEKASLISKREISSMVSPAFLRARGMATVGAMGKSMGAIAASANPT